MLACFFKSQNQSEKPTIVVLRFPMEHPQIISGKKKAKTFALRPPPVTGGSRLLQLKYVILPEENLQGTQLPERDANQNEDSVKLLFG